MSPTPAVITLAGWGQCVPRPPRTNFWSLYKSLLKPSPFLRSGTFLMEASARIVKGLGMPPTLYGVTFNTALNVFRHATWGCLLTPKLPCLKIGGLFYGLLYGTI